MCIDGHISGSASQALMLPVWNVFFGLGVDVFFGQAKVNDVDNVFLFIPLPPNEKVFRFYISIDEIFRVHILHSRYLAWNKSRPQSSKRNINIFQIQSQSEPQSQQSGNQNVKITQNGHFRCTSLSKGIVITLVLIH